MQNSRVYCVDDEGLVTLPSIVTLTTLAKYVPLGNSLEHKKIFFSHYKPHLATISPP